MWITLDKIKSHLNIDKDYNDDDELLIFYGQVAEEAIEKDLNCKLANLMTNDGYIPFSVQSAILLMIGNLYSNREGVSIGGNPVKIPFGMQYLIDLNKCYKTKF